MRDELRENCRGRWHSIFLQLGIPARALSGYNVPCPMCQGKDRFQFTDLDGKGTYHCRGCGGDGSGGGGDGFALAMKFLGVNFVEAVKRIEDVLGTSLKKPGRDNDAARDYAREAQGWLWKNSPGLTGEDPPSWYLAGRGLTGLPPIAAIRWAEHIKDKDPDTNAITHWHAMMARFVAPDDSRACLHMTLLDSGGQKAAVKRVKQFARGCVVPKGGAVRLADPAEEMGVAEGIETALSASVIWKIPVWAALSTGGLVNFVPPAICRKLVIFADRDAKFAGQFAAFGLAHKLGFSTDLSLSVEMPTNAEFKDWNDVLKARMAATDNVVPLR